jgi:alkanesulfonate monooxygenase SsuD/methylene tetrahydromethanopterin reductase-like flavin-dependent oxidoreductase (luciferase family)
MRFGLFIMGTRSGGYHAILEQVCQAEELGFHVVLLAERHFRHGELLYPAPFIMAAAIAARTKRIRIGTAARILPLDHPLVIAEEAAALDILSSGRLDFGATRASLDEQCHEIFHSPRAESRGRFEEALEVITRAWTQERFSYYGKHYQIAEVSEMLRPLQTPHPPIYLVATSPETTAFAARKGYAMFLPAIQSLADLRETSAVYWRGFQEAGHGGSPVDLAVNRFVYVADSDARARREIRQPFLSFLSERAPDLKAALLRKYQTEAHLCFDRFLEDFCLFGSPESVGAQIQELQERIGLTYLLCSLNFITLDHAACVRSMKRFAREVMPRFTTLARERRLQEVPT